MINKTKNFGKFAKKREITGITRRMTNYYLYIKSHCNFPDYEDSVEAESKDEAVKMFYASLKGEYDMNFLKENVVAEEEINR